MKKNQYYQSGTGGVLFSPLAISNFRNDSAITGAKNQEDMVLKVVNNLEKSFEIFGNFGWRFLQ